MKTSIFTILSLGLLLIACDVKLTKADLVAKQNAKTNLDRYIPKLNSSIITPEFIFTNYYNQQNIIDIKILKFSTLEKEYHFPLQLMAGSNLDKVHPHYVFPPIERPELLPDSVVKAYEKIRLALYTNSVDCTMTQTIRNFMKETIPPRTGYKNRVTIEIISDKKPRQFQLYFYYGLHYNLKYWEEINSKENY